MNNVDNDYARILENRKRGFHLTLYSLQGGPLPERAWLKLEAEAERIANEFNLAIQSTLE